MVRCVVGHVESDVAEGRIAFFFRIILVKNQLDALFSMYLFHSLRASSNPDLIIKRIELYQYIIWYVSLCVVDCLVCRSGKNFIPS